MELKQGMCISSTTQMDDPHFINTTIIITELNESGAIGFILNHPFGHSLNELAEFSTSKTFPLHTGGPVDQEHLYFIHRQPLVISEGQLIANDLYLGGNFSEAVKAINAGLLTANDIKIFVGYCGWDAGELEAEIAEESWGVEKLLVNELFQLAPYSI